MKSRLVLIACVLIAGALHAQTGTGVIDGGIADDAGSPVPKATVTLLNESGRAIRTLEADERGGFVFDALAEGRYMVSASRVGYSTRAYGQNSPSAFPVAIALGNNGRFRARVKLARLATISGSISDEQGRATSANVRAQRFVMRDGTRQLDDRALTTTADRQGRYRFTDVEPGEYLISALGPEGELRRMNPDLIQRAQQAVDQRLAPLPDSGDRDAPVSFVPVYFPGVISRNRATPVAIVPGEEHSGVNLQLQVLPAIRVQGSVFNPDGKPVPFAVVNLMSADDGSVWASGQTTAAGVFNLASVPPGKYMVVTAGARVDVSLTDASASTVTVRAASGGSISGRVVFDGTSPRLDCRRVSCKPMLRLRNSPLMSGTATDVGGIMDEAGPVIFSGVPAGSYTIGIGVPLAGWRMTSAIIDGKDAMDVPIDVEPRQDLSGLVVTFSDRNTDFAGNVAVGGTAPTADLVSVVIFPTDEHSWFAGARRVRVVRPDTRGDYHVSNLPAGEYFVATVTNFDAEIEIDAARLSTLQAGANRTIVRPPEPR